MWVVDLNAEEARAEIVDVVNRGEMPERFQPHGMYVSNRTNILYTVNHAGTYTGIEVFDILYEDEEHGRPRLRYAASVRGDFHLYSLNDVAEGAHRGELYVTQWLPFGYPSNGKKGSNLSAFDRVRLAAPLFTGVFGVRTTSVYRCTFSADGRGEDSRCEDATIDAKRFIGANGITISADRETVFVNDPADKKITVFRRRDKDGRLEFTGTTIDLPFAADNVEYDDGDLIMGSIPILHIAVDNEGLALEDAQPVPGGVMRARLDSISNEWTVTTLLNHDGTALSQIAAASRYGRRLFLGSPFSTGLLECDL